MDNYFEMEAAQKSNYRRLRQLDKKQKHSIVRDSTEKSSSFSMRMIIVLLILSVTMFLKQTDVLSGNRVYASAMAEIQRIVDILKKMHIISMLSLDKMHDWQNASLDI